MVEWKCVSRTALSLLVGTFVRSSVFQEPGPVVDHHELAAGDHRRAGAGAGRIGERRAGPHSTTVMFGESSSSVSRCIPG